MKLSIICCVYNQEELIVKALDSVPRRDDIEVIIINDGSTDNTKEVIENYRDAHLNLKIKIVNFTENKGLGYAKNFAYDMCIGDYVGELDSDDYLYTEKFNKLIDEIDYKYDIIGFDLETNDGTIFKLCEESVHGFCSGAMRFIKRSFMNDCRYAEVRAGEDWYLNEKLMEKNPKIKYTHEVAYHYNFPREGSLYDLMV